MTDSSPSNKKGGSFFARFVLFVILAALVLFALQKMGLKSVDVQEKSELTDDPHPGF